MAHNVKSMMYAGIAPWHGLGIGVGLIRLGGHRMKGG